MAMKSLSPQAALRLINLSSSKTPPPRQIVELKEQIAVATTVLEKASSSNGRIDQLAVKIIVNMKLDLDTLYGAWAEGKLDNESRILRAQR